MSSRDRASLMVVLYVEEPGEVAQRAVAFAGTLGEPIHAFAAGREVALEGVDTVHVAEGDAFSSFAPAAIARALVELTEKVEPTAVVAAGTPRGNEVLAHASAMADLPLAANCVDVTGGDPIRVTRVRWGGSLLEEAAIHGSPAFMTVQPHSVAPATGPDNAAVERFTPQLSEADLVARVIDRVGAATGGVSLADAKVVVSWTRAGSPEGDHRGARRPARQPSDAPARSRWPAGAPTDRSGRPAPRSHRTSTSRAASRARRSTWPVARARKRSSP
jgi:electron transfer flavoprotein alpha subunit